MSTFYKGEMKINLLYLSQYRQLNNKIIMGNILKLTTKTNQNQQYSIIIYKNFNDIHLEKAFTLNFLKISNLIK